MAQPPSSAARTSPSAARNREPILAVLKTCLPAAGAVLEVAAGAGEHAAWFAAAFPHLQWLPTDPDPEALASIAAWRQATGLANLAAPQLLDAAKPAETWPISQADAVVCINMIHIAPWSAARGLMAGAGKLLPAGGALVLYGPYLERDIETAPSNREFDRSLKLRNAEWGLRNLDDVKALAARSGLALAERVAMPANNLTLVFRKGA